MKIIKQDNNNCNFFIDEITFNPDTYVGKYEIRYGVDKIEFISKQTAHNVEADIHSIRPIKREYGSVKVFKIKNNKNSRELYKQGYRARIILHNITSELLDFLQPVKEIIGRPHSIEIFQDIVCRTNQEAIRLADYQIYHGYMRYKHGTVDSHIYNRNRIRTYTKGKPPENILTEEEYVDWLWNLRNSQKWLLNRKKNIIGDRTLYLGNKEDHFQFVIYARLSKIDKRPVVHSEFRLSGKKQMQALGILDRENGYLFTIKNDLMLHAAQQYKILLKKRIKFKKVNELKLGKHYLGWSNKKKFSEEENKQINFYANVVSRLYRRYTAGFIKFADHMNLDKRLFLE